MPITNGSTYALVIVSLGILGIIVSFQVVDRKKYFMALGLSVLVVAMGLFEFVNTSLFQWRAARRIAKLQETSRLDLEALQARLRETIAEKGRRQPAAPPPAAAVDAPAPAPAAPAPAAGNKKRR